MKKRILAVLLTLAMVLGMLPMTTLAEQTTVQEFTGPVYRAAHVSAIAADGLLETAWLTDGTMTGGDDHRAFGVLWKGDKLYVAAVPQAGDMQMNIVLDDTAITVTKTDSGATVTGVDGAVAAWTDSAVEVSVPWQTVTTFGKIADLSLSMGGTAWSGVLVASSLERTFKPAASQWRLGSASGISDGVEVNGDSYRFSSIYGEETNTEGQRQYVLAQFNQLVGRTTGFDLEFDFRMDKMPEFDAVQGTPTFINYGFSYAMTDDTNAGYSAAITNTANGLIFALLDGNAKYHYVEIGKKLGDTFHVRVEWAMDKRVSLYIDGQLLKTFDDAEASGETMSGRSWAGKLLTLNLKRNTAGGSAADDMDFTISNITLGKSYDEHPLAGLDFAAISGSNASAEAVGSDLELPGSYLHPSNQLPTVELTWTSSHPEIISNTGKVSPSGTTTEVVLTAALASDADVTKTITMTVVRMFRKVYVSADNIALDGTIDKAYYTTLPFGATQGDAAPSGDLHAAWGKGNLYLAVEFTGATALELKLNGNTVTVDLTTGVASPETFGVEAKVAGNVVEVAVPLAQVGVNAYDYNQYMPLAAKLIGTGGSAALFDWDLDLLLTSDMAYAGGLAEFTNRYDRTLPTTTTYDGNGFLTSLVSSANLVQDNKMVIDTDTISSYPTYLSERQLAEIDHTKDIMLTQTIYVEAMPVTTGGYDNFYQGRGYHGWIVEGVPGAGKPGVSFNIYNDAEKGLVLQIPKCNGTTNFTEVVNIPLNKAVGDTFTFDFLWRKDNQVEVYIDEVLMGTATGVVWATVSDGTGYDSYDLRYLQAADAGKAKIVVSDIAILLSDNFGVRYDRTLPTATVSAENGFLTSLVSSANLVQDNKMVIDSSKISSYPTYLSERQLAEIDHTKDLMLTQTIYVEAMPVTAGGYDNFYQGRGYHGWIVEGAPGAGKPGVSFNIYNDAGKGLVLQIPKCNGTTNFTEIVSIPLNKAVGDTFKFDLLWRKDNQVEVYIDGALMGTATGVVWATASDGTGYDSYDLRYLQAADAGDAKITVSKIAIVHPGAEITRYDRTLPTATASQGNGLLKTLVSSANLVKDNKMVIDSNTISSYPTYLSERQLPEIDHSKDMLLTQTIRVDAMPVTTGGFASYSAANGYYGWIVDGASGAVKLGVSYNIYNDATNGLTLQIPVYSGATTISGVIDIPLGKTVGSEFTFGLVWRSNNQIEVYIDQALVHTIATGSVWVLPNSDGVGYDGYDLRYSQAAADGSVKIEVSNVAIVHSGVYVQDLSVFEPVSNSFPGADYSNGVIVLDASKVTNVVGIYQKGGVTGLDHSKDTMFVQDLLIRELPATDSGTIGVSSGSGYYFWVVNGGTNSSDTTSARHGVTCNIYNHTTKGLVLQIQSIAGSNTDEGAVYEIPLGKNVGEKFSLGLLWGKSSKQNVAPGCDCTKLEVYVDGQKVGGVEGARVCWTTTSNGMSYEGVSLRCLKESGLKATVSDIRFLEGCPYGEIYDSIYEELTQEKVLGELDLSNITGDVDLPDVFSSPYLGDVPLVWISANPAVLNPETGKVNRPVGGVGIYVPLTLTVPDVDDKEIFRMEAYVAPTGTIQIVSSEVLGAAYTGTAITPDGSIDSAANAEQGWSMNTLVGNGRFGAQWDADKLYLAVRNPNGEALSIVLNTVTVSSANATIATSADGTVTEIAVDMSALNISVEDYGQEIAATVTLGGESWSGKIKLTSTHWITTDTSAPRIPVGLKGNESLSVDEPTANQGIATLSDGYRLYDLFDIGGNNPASVRNYLLFWGETAKADWEKELFLPLDSNADVATFLEFDFFAASMPVYALGTDIATNRNYSNCGFNFWISSDQIESYCQSISAGIINTVDGLVFVARGADGDQNVVLNKQVGDYFRVGVRWERNGDLTLFVDGVKVATLTNIEMSRHGFGHSSVMFNTLRSTVPAASSNDNIDISLTNIAIGKTYGDSLMDQLTFDVIKGENTDPYAVTENLELPTDLTDGQLSTGSNAIAWSSSDPDVIAADGTVNQPETSGKAVTLTATYNGTAKEFLLYVPGLAPDGKVMAVKNDKDTANGAGQVEDVYLFTLDTTNNSIIYDLGSSQTVNVIELTDSDATNRLNESVLTIWVSEDNVTYTQVEDYFKILRAGEKTYLYDFNATGRYIKLHCTHYNAAEASFTSILSQMITVYYSEIFGDGGSGFAVESTITVTNDREETAFDTIHTVTAAEAGVASLADMADVRFFQDDELLYHYYDAATDSFTFRVTEIPAAGSAEITVLSGNTEAMDIANKEYVYEVVYGTREGYSNELSRWYLSMPDGTMWSFKGIEDEYFNTLYKTGYRISYNKGMTWSEAIPIEESYQWMYVPTGAVYDDHNGRIIVTGYHRLDNGGMLVRFLYSDDMGQTWNRCEDCAITGPDAFYSLSYSDPVELSCYDGMGPNVDFVLNCAAMNPDYGTTMVTRVIYSTDAGLTWTYGPSEIRYSEGTGTYVHEGGFNEATILERDDGVLVLYARCQYGNVDTFGRSFSYDHGKTWSEGELSEVYAPNTQPIMFEHYDNQYMFWGGNNVLGGLSYQRFPFTVGISYDDLMTFENIQDMYSRYSMQGMTMATRTYVVNQTLDSIGDTITMAWNGDYGTVILRVDNFTDYFFRTRGAYDSFENTSVKYEGWSLTGGNAEITDQRSTDGSYAMKIFGSTSIVRSIPYLQNGSVSFDLYLEDVEDYNMEIELESAYGTEFGKAAPIALTIRDGGLWLRTADGTEVKLNTVPESNAWNHFVFDLNLLAETPAATLSINGSEAEAIPVIASIGDYVCYVDINNKGLSGTWMDSFLVLDDDNSFVPETEEKITVEELTEVPETLAESYDSVEALVAYLKMLFVQSNEAGYTEENTVVLDVNMLITHDNGKTWKPAETKDFPTEGITVKLEYPEGTSPDTHEFQALHLFTADSYRLQTTAGQWELPVIREEADGIYVTLTGMSPLVLGWRTEGPELPGFSGFLTLNETIDLNVIIPEGVEIEGNVISVKFSDGTDAPYTLVSTEHGMAIRHSLFANQMTREITVQILDSEGDPLTKALTISVRGYVEKLLEITTDPVEKALVIRMLDYGALAQLYVNPNATDLANSIIDAELRDFINTYNMGTPDAYTPATGSTGGVFYGNLTLSESIVMNIMTNTAHIGENEKLVVKLDGEELAEDRYQLTTEADGTICISYSFHADKMNRVLTVAIVDKDSGGIQNGIDMSVRKYAHMILEAYRDIDPTLCAMLVAMLDYGALAQVYGNTATDDLANRYVSADQRNMLTEYIWPAN